LNKYLHSDKWNRNEYKYKRKQRQWTFLKKHCELCLRQNRFSYKTVFCTVFEWATVSRCVGTANRLQPREPRNRYSIPCRGRRLFRFYKSSWPALGRPPPHLFSGCQWEYNARCTLLHLLTGFRVLKVTPLFHTPFYHVI
jgi:hypothetical protein